jgi:hypothetical protein
MADKKISALTSATTPLAGTEVLPIVQSGATVKVAVSDLTAGRAISATAVTASTGSFVVGTSGQGVDFSATPGTGTSELLSDYEEGTWTPTDASGAGLSLTVTQATYTKVGRQVTAQLYVTYPTTADVSGAAISLPFAPTLGLFQATSVNYTNSTATLAAINASNVYMNLYAGVSALANAGLSGKFLIFTIVYFV